MSYKIFKGVEHPPMQDCHCSIATCEEPVVLRVRDYPSFDGHITMCGCKKHGQFIIDKFKQLGMTIGFGDWEAEEVFATKVNPENN